MAKQGHAAQVATRVLGPSESGYYAWRTRAPSARAIRHMILTDAIRQIHAASNGIYGARRVHADLTLGRGIQVWHGPVPPEVPVPPVATVPSEPTAVPTEPAKDRALQGPSPGSVARPDRPG